jgi:hypothetical protein
MMRMAVLINKHIDTFSESIGNKINEESVTVNEESVTVSLRWYIANTAICKIIGNRATDSNGFLYLFTTEKLSKTVAQFSIILQIAVNKHAIMLLLIN